MDMNSSTKQAIKNRRKKEKKKKDMNSSTMTRLQHAYQQMDNHYSGRQSTSGGVLYI